jgi:hypothetical protein
MRWVLALAAALACQGCGLAFYAGPGLLDVDVADAPPGTRVVLRGLDNDVERELPAHARQIALRRGSSYALAITAPGYKPALELVRKQPAPTVYLDSALMIVGIGTVCYGLLSGNLASFFHYGMIGAGVTLAGEGAALVEAATNTDSTFDRLDVKVKLEPRP